MRATLFSIIIALLSVLPLKAHEAYLLTCSPGTEAYTVYGHTALRLHLTEPQADIVINYGVFNFHEEHFLWRWLLGDTHYTAEALPYDLFRELYRQEGRQITEQRLNLRDAEMETLIRRTLTDAQAAQQTGWTYPYNFFYDNCTTRVIDAVTEALGDSAHIEWPKAQEQTLREMLHQFAQPTSPWMSEGQDFLIGTEVDQPATMRQQLFSPIWASHYMGQATIVRADGSRTPLVSEPAATLPDAESSNPLELPLCIAGLLLLAAIFYQRFRGGWWQVHMLLHTLQGIVGLLVAFLFFFSSHPAVDSNWLLAAFNPLWFVAAWYRWRHRGHITGRAGWCYTGSIVLMIALMLVGKISGQDYPLTAILLNIYFLLSLPRYDKTK